MTSFIDEDESITNLSISMGNMSVEDPEPSLLLAPSRVPSPIPFDLEAVIPLDEQIARFNEQAKSVGAPGGVPKFAVVLSPDGYKHEFPRNWVSKRELSTVVENPGRLKASSLGVGLARTVVPFKLLKSSERRSLFSPHVERVHGRDWAVQLYALCSRATAALAKKELEVPETWPYYDIYLSPNTAEALEGNVAALEMACDEIFAGPVHRCFVVVRPPGHHCNEDEVSGFCLMNNAHIAIQYAKAKYDVTHAVILDFDLHHGDGSQDLLWKLGFNNDDLRMGYFSLHDIHSFPCELGDRKKLTDASVCFVAHDSAIWNVHFKPYETEEEFQSLYESHYSQIFERAAEFLEKCRDEVKSEKPFNPLVVISAGFDGSEFEGSGMQRHQVHVPTSFYNRFTRDSVALAENFGSGHLLSLLEGGYSSPAIATGVFSHLTGMGERPYDPKWCPSTAPHEIELGMRQRWKLHPEHWTGSGVSIGRTLFPVSSPAPVVTEKHNLRRRHHS